MSGAVFALVKRWKEFDFAELQGVMDSEAADITCRQDMCEMSRNTLVELTRQFRRDTPEDVRKQVVPVLKSYQSEVDRLSQRCKTAETAFLNVYKKMIDCPDMQPVLEYVVAADTEMKRLADVNMHNEQLRQTIDDLQHELQQAQQHESTVEKMKDQLAQYDQHQQQLVEAAVSEKQKELSAELDECRQMQHDTQLLSGRKLAEAEDRVNQLAAALEMSQNEVLQVKAQLEGLSGSRTDELDMLTVDLERCNERAALAEREVHVLKEQLAASHQNQHPQHASSLSCAEDDLNDGEMAASQRSAVEHQLAAKEKEISQLVEEVQRLQSQLSQLETQCLSQRVQLEDQLGERNSIISRLESVLDRQKDYDDVKKELEIMKSVEFSGASQLCDEDGHQVIDTSQSLEVLIMEKNRALQNETTALKNNNAHLQARLDDILDERQRLLETLQQREELVERLEKDVGNIGSACDLYRRRVTDEVGAVTSADLLTEAVGSLELGTWPARQEDTSKPAVDSAANTMLLPIVAAQRERFRERVDELEQQLQRLQRHMSLKDSDLQDLRKDNVKLYEKIRFLQSYSAKRGEGSEDVEARYSAQYERGLDPFNRFARRETARKYAQLGPFEKITLSMGRTILSNKWARSITCVYTLLLHLLVFGVLYKLAYIESSERQSAVDCVARYAEHMREYHERNLSETNHGAHPPHGGN